ncbi:asparagine synthase (glutamine-hydrolyzing) [Arthrobacter sp. VKM Ac-2550]|uniref:asparagine synthase (glutamine-hydrolyzing) n=1 Tax=Crystallibacter permensis TaxID=1938888 RepID=UPI0022263567|nr:asparagine synthase (glutamine-hydrolyzing) [Arthrobacter sp. VKM Ac-2550]MCW2134944.1 asparagine synthase (glutamine-hydrolyzing) [Arthrobacter sp. VKM Ac-2550]
MSGIVAAHGPFDPETGKRMLDRLSHRGPDGVGFRQCGPSWLGNRYLAIVDPAHGGQPLSGSTEDIWLVGDGEIYNHQRIRARLGADRFHTGSDLEAAVQLYEEIGVAAFEKLWGTFALVIASEDGRFVAARDPLGLAPLYWARQGQTVLFASEMKAFDEQWRPSVEPFPPGHAWTPEAGLIPGPVFPSGAPVLLKSRTPEEDPPTWVFDALRETLVRAVERSMQVDVPVGVLLSGGVDSSIVTAIASRIAGKKGKTLKTFAVGMAGSADLAAARVVAEHCGTEHHEHVYTAEDAIDLVPQVIAELESFDPTLVHSAVPNHLVSRLAQDHIKIVLVGEGADELFAGYSHYGEHSSGEALHQDLLDTIEGLHIGGLQRVDRVAGAHGLEPRLPFLDLDMVELALALPPAWKLTSLERPAKWLLRRAFDGWIPDEVLWRPKEQFGQGTGMNDVLRGHFGATISDEELARESGVLDPPLRTGEELAYYRMFTAALPGVNAQKTVGRFVEA